MFPAIIGDTETGPVNKDCEPERNTVPSQLSREEVPMRALEIYMPHVYNSRFIFHHSYLPRNKCPFKSKRNFLFRPRPREQLLSQGLPSRDMCSLSSFLH